MSEILLNPVLWYVLIGLVLGGGVVYIFFKYEWTKWVIATVLALGLLGSSIYCSVLLNDYYSADGGVVGVLNKYIYNTGTVEKNDNYKITLSNISFKATSNANQYDATIILDDTLELEKNNKYSLFVNETPCSMVISSDSFITSEYGYNFVNEEHEVLLNDTLKINCGFYDKYSTIHLVTNGGSEAVKYWNRYFEKNNIVLEIKEFSYNHDNIIDDIDKDISESDLSNIFTVNYYYEENIIDTQYYIKNSNIRLINYKDRNSYAFIGWSLDKTNILDNCIVEDNLSLYAMFDEELLATEPLNNALAAMENGVLVLDNENIKAIPDEFFMNNTEIKEVQVVNLSNGIILGSNVFNGCINLKTINLSDYTTIGDFAFAKTGLTDVVAVSTNVFGDYVFSDCANLTNVNLINSSLTKIPEGMFKNCTSLISVACYVDGTSNNASVVYNSNVKSIGDKAFAGCTGLTTVTISSSINTIGKNVFNGCDLKITCDFEEGTKVYSKNWNYNGEYYLEVSYYVVGDDTVVDQPDKEPDLEDDGFDLGN